MLDSTETSDVLERDRGSTLLVLLSSINDTTSWLSLFASFFTYLQAALLSFCIWLARKLSLRSNHCKGSISNCLKAECRRSSPLRVTALTKWSSCCSTKDFVFKQNSSRVLFSLLTSILITLLMHSGQLLWYSCGGLPKPAFSRTGAITAFLKSLLLFLTKYEKIEAMNCKAALCYSIHLPGMLTSHQSHPRTWHLPNPQ